MVKLQDTHESLVTHKATLDAAQADLNQELDRAKTQVSMCDIIDILIIYEYLSWFDEICMHYWSDFGCGAKDLDQELDQAKSKVSMFEGLDAWYVYILCILEL